MTSTPNTVQLPNLNCGSCGYKTCDEFAVALPANPGLLKRCIHLVTTARATDASDHGSCDACDACAPKSKSKGEPWQDSLGRPFDFVLDLFPNEPGPRETILPHNPMTTRELDVKVGDILIGRPLGMSCGCPITHCGVATHVDMKTGVIVWCVTGPLNPRQKGFKDLGYYSAQAYEGLVTQSRAELKVGMRYWFMPHKCMLQWRHSGLINFVNKLKSSGLFQIRLEGLMIG